MASTTSSRTVAYQQRLQSLFSWIIQLTISRGHTTVSNTSLAERFCCSTSTISKMVRDLRRSQRIVSTCTVHRNEARFWTCRVITLAHGRASASIGSEPSEPSNLLVLPLPRRPVAAVDLPAANSNPEAA